MEKLWSSTWVRFLVAVGLLALLLWASYELRRVLIPLTLAFIVAYIFDPLVDLLERRKVPRALSIALLIVLMIGIFAAAVFVVVPRLIQQSAGFVRSFRENFPELKETILSASSRFGDTALGAYLEANLEAILDALKSHVPQVLGSVETALSHVVTGTVGVVGSIMTVLLFAVVSVYLLKDFDSITAKVKELIPPARREAVLRIFGKIDVNLKSFFRGQIIVCTILAAFYAVGFAIVGVPFGVLIALIGGYGQIVPYLGTALAIVPAALLTLIEFGDVWHPAAALAVIAAGQVLEGFVITPKVVGETTGLHPVVVILAILVFGDLLGFLGILLAVPLAAVLKVMVGEAVERYRQSSLFKE
jgi:predicted PurR-regulated permease PerM